VFWGTDLSQLTCLTARQSHYLPRNWIFSPKATKSGLWVAPWQNGSVGKSDRQPAREKKDEGGRMKDETRCERDRGWCSYARANIKAKRPICKYEKPSGSRRDLFLLHSFSRRYSHPRRVMARIVSEPDTAVSPVIRFRCGWEPIWHYSKSTDSIWSRSYSEAARNRQQHWPAVKFNSTSLRRIRRRSCSGHIFATCRLKKTIGHAGFMR
jgi:hypothetical protein